MARAARNGGVAGGSISKVAAFLYATSAFLHEGAVICHRSAVFLDGMLTRFYALAVRFDVLMEGIRQMI
ncbi:hypothetical protein K469DRAFT_713532 [Zopfia rhizophila CBS 207.26]|uniref:Uncharacterized protein n=1 Tax=Zopfia rhizophila CBS 207.26 TaxID=1314779 RepID=A0A6A6DSI9_9PEZI|nr:hypothetical protein K469DRAFT_713688 [Zopfia rhizophila CBS 207.26]KAF2181478.1 hypothetical protein K469DRAFT_713532 [Zopfia rhizophila CBS 207.26]